MSVYFAAKGLELLGKSVDVLVPGPKAANHTERETFQRRPEAREMGAGRDLSGLRKDNSEFQ